MRARVEKVTVLGWNKSIAIGITISTNCDYYSLTTTKISKKHLGEGSNYVNKSNTPVWDQRMRRRRRGQGLGEVGRVQDSLSYLGSQPDNLKLYGFYGEGGDVSYIPG